MSNASNPSSNPHPTAYPVAEPVVSHSAPPPTIIVRPNGGGLMWRLMAFFGWLAFGFVALIAISQYYAFLDYFDTSHGITEKFHSGERFAANKVAIISVEGIIADGEGYVRSQIDRVRKDESVKAIVVRVNSPGGTVTASDYIFHHLNKLREDRKIPLVVSMGGIAASGGYYVSMSVGDQQQCIYAEPTTTTGSIGVMFPHYDVSGLMARFDVKDDTVVTHPRKEMGSMTKPMSDEHRGLIQAYIGESFQRFKDVVKQGRPKFREDPSALDQLATGEIFTANQAKKHGLVDEIGFLEDALDRAISLAGLSKGSVRVVQFNRPVSLFGLGGLAMSPHDSERLQESRDLWELATPQAYYLATTIPPTITTFLRRVGQSELAR